MTTRRRGLAFDRLDAVMLDVDRLLAGHAMVGAWTLGQALHHCATAIRLTVSRAGRVGAGVAISPAEDAARRQFFEEATIPDGRPIPLATLEPPADCEDREEAGSLRRAIEAFDRAEGPFPSHPMLGPLSKDEWAAFHCIHCAHHLEFAIPTPDRGAPA